MRPGRPVLLDRLERDQMHQLTSSAAENATAARNTLATARDFLATATRSLAENRRLPAVSNYHEAARLAITAIATSRGRRFGNQAGAHEAVVDYALGTGIVDADQHAKLDQLRELRHQVNYPADLIEPSDRDLRHISDVVNRIIDAVANTLTPAPKPKKIPPPPKPPRRS